MGIKIVDRKEIYRGKGVVVEQRTTLNPDDETKIRDAVIRPDAVAIAAITSDDDVILIEQYRAAIDKIIVEIPAGKVDEGEDIIEAGLRELVEETGYKSNDVVYLGSIFASPGYTNEKIHLLIARNVMPGEANPQGDEKYNKIIKVPLDKLVSYLFEKDNRIVDGKTLALALALKSEIDKTVDNVINN